jgi:DsbC/DsbD-like thiol-disulfide interchange protein
VVTASARPAGAIAPGREFDVVVSVTVQDGWHIYANPTGAPELKPTSLELDPASGPSTTLVKVAYPAGEAKVLGSIGTEKIPLYEGKVQFTARLRLAADAKPGPVQLTLKLTYQACNDRLCLAPAKLEIPLDVSVAR